MNDLKIPLAKNLAALRARSGLTQEGVAEHIGVSRQAVAKWEAGESQPDLLNCAALAALYGVSLDDLVHYDEAKAGLLIPPKDKHIIGIVTLGERGQLVLPKKARELSGFAPGDRLMLLCDTAPESAGLALVAADRFLGAAAAFFQSLQPFMEEQKEEP